MLIVQTSCALDLHIIISCITSFTINNRQEKVPRHVRFYPGADTDLEEIYWRICPLVVWLGGCDHCDITSFSRRSPHSHAEDGGVHLGEDRGGGGQSD